MARFTLPCVCFALLAMLSASQQVTKVIDAKGDEAELASMVRKERATGSEAMAVNSEGEVSSLVRRHTDNQDPEQEDFVDAPLQEGESLHVESSEEAASHNTEDGEPSIALLEEQDHEPEDDEDDNEEELPADALLEEQEQEPEDDEDEEGQIEMDSAEGLGERDDDIMNPEQEALLEEQEQGPEDDEEGQITADPPPEDEDVIEEDKLIPGDALLEEQEQNGTVIWNPEDAAETTTEEINTEGQTPADLSQDAEDVMNDPNIVSLPQITADPTEDNATEAPETETPATLGVSTLGGPENGGHYGSEATLG